MTQTKKNHPSSMIQGGPYASAAEDFMPSNQLIEANPLLSGLNWGVRTCFIPSNHTQYMIYDPDGINVIASGSTPEFAALGAERRFALERKTPEDYSPSLIGCRFFKDLKKLKNIVNIQVFNANGILMGESGDGRDSAVKDAVININSMREVSDMSFDEYKTISFAVPVNSTIGMGIFPPMFDSNDPSLNQGLDLIWSKDHSLADKYEDKKVFKREIKASLLRSLISMDCDVKDVFFNFNEGISKFVFVFHKENVSTQLALELDFQCQGGVIPGSERLVERMVG